MPLLPVTAVIAAAMKLLLGFEKGLMAVQGFAAADDDDDGGGGGTVRSCPSCSGCG